jgi:hypothetical protein
MSSQSSEDRPPNDYWGYYYNGERHDIDHRKQDSSSSSANNSTGDEQTPAKKATAKKALYNGGFQLNPTSANTVKDAPYTMQQKHARIRSFVSSGLHRIGCVKDGKTLKYLGAASFDKVVTHIQKKMDHYNAEHIGDTQMSFNNIELDHIKPVQRFGLEVSHYTNIQPMLKRDNRGKGAKWSSADESFWRENIQLKSAFTCIYTNNPTAHPSVGDNSSSVEKQHQSISAPPARITAAKCCVSCATTFQAEWQKEISDQLVGYDSSVIHVIINSKKNANGRSLLKWMCMPPKIGTDGWGQQKVPSLMNNGKEIMAWCM